MRSGGQPVNDWRIPGELRPAEQEERLSVDVKLVAARAALSIVRDAVDQERSKIAGKRWSQRDRLEYIATICDNSLQRIK
jgi:hypothetical protein